MNEICEPCAAKYKITRPTISAAIDARAPEALVPASVPKRGFTNVGELAAKLQNAPDAAAVNAAMKRKTLADIKRRIIVGSRLECVAHTKRPELVGTIRRVVEAKTVAFVSNIEGQTPERFWTRYPKASGVTVIDQDTFLMAITSPYGVQDPEHTVTLRFLPDAPTGDTGAPS